MSYTPGEDALTSDSAPPAAIPFADKAVTNNAAPPAVANAIANQPAVAGTAFNFAFAADTFSDANGDTLSYTATQDDGTALPAWLSFAAGTRTFSGTPQTADVGTVTVKVTASDGTDSVSDTFDIVVRTEANSAPTVASAIANQTATAGTAFNFQFAENTFNDTNSGDTLSYTARKDDGTALPAWLSFAAGTRTFSGTPRTADVGTLSVTVTADDGTHSVSDTFDIVVGADVTAPAVTISGVPASIDATAAFTVTFAWSEDVTGFVTGDVTVSGGDEGDVHGGERILLHADSDAVRERQRGRDRGGGRGDRRRRQHGTG